MIKLELRTRKGVLCDSLGRPYVVGPFARESVDHLNARAKYMRHADAHNAFRRVSDPSFIRVEEQEVET